MDSPNHPPDNVDPDASMLEGLLSFIAIVGVWLIHNLPFILSFSISIILLIISVIRLKIAIKEYRDAFKIKK